MWLLHETIIVRARQQCSGSFTAQVLHVCICGDVRKIKIFTMVFDNSGTSVANLKLIGLIRAEI